MIAKGREYYVAPAYPMLYAAGSVRVEAWLESLRSPWASILRRLVWTASGRGIAIAAAVTLPLARVNSAWFKTLVEFVAHIRDSLPTENRIRLGILATNYEEAGAVNLYGTQYGLPRAISGVNSFWEQGYGNPPPPGCDCPTR